MYSEALYPPAKFRLTRTNVMPLSQGNSCTSTSQFALESADKILGAGTGGESKIPHRARCSTRAAHPSHHDPIPSHPTLRTGCLVVVSRDPSGVNHSVVSKFWLLGWE